MKLGLVAAGIFLALSGTAQAEVGKASGSPGEWFLGFNIGGGASWGPDKQAYSILDRVDSTFLGQVLHD